MVKNCIKFQVINTAQVVVTATAAAVATTLTAGATFQINNTKFYVPVVALSISDSIKFLENMK